MIRINRQTDYAIRVVLALSKRETGSRPSSRTIRQEMLIPEAFITRIIARLANVNLIHTYTGRNGGLELACPSSQITLRDVVEAFEGPILLSECMQAKSEDECPFRNDCPVRSKWGRIQAVLMREMAKITFQDLAEETIEIPFGIMEPSF